MTPWTPGRSAAPAEFGISGGEQQIRGIVLCDDQSRLPAVPGQARTPGAQLRDRSQALCRDEPCKARRRRSTCRGVRSISLTNRPTYDLDKAAALLKEAGVSSAEFEYLVQPQHTERVSWGEMVQADLAKLGIKMNIVKLDTTSWNAVTSAASGPTKYKA
jgi:hypothetical protein